MDQYAAMFQHEADCADAKRRAADERLEAVENERQHLQVTITALKTEIARLQSRCEGLLKNVDTACCAERRTRSELDRAEERVRKLEGAFDSIIGLAECGCETSDEDGVVWGAKRVRGR